VFAPASLCFNAISFLLDIPKQVHDFHGEINAIFAEVGPAMTQFKVYQRMDENTGVDESLRAAIHEVMVSFVDICADCINIHKEGRWKSLKRNAKRIILDDKSVQTELENFKELTQRQFNLQATLTLEVALETKQYARFIKTTIVEIETNTKAIKTDVSSLVEANQKRSLDETYKGHLATIKKKLGLKDEQVANASHLSETMWENSIENGGEWLNDLDQYKEWVDRNNTNAHLLLLTGGPGTGKSYLVSTIAQMIRSQNSASSSISERSLIGYYSFSLSTKDDEHRPQKALKIICAQLAEKDVVYAQKVANACGEKDETFFKNAGCAELWKALAIDFPATNTAHYIILDSVGVLNPNELEELMEAVRHKPVVDSAEDKGSRVRILASGEREAFQLGGFDLQIHPNIDITEHNTDDIGVFIEQEFKKAGVFQGEDEDALQLKEKFKRRLLVRSNNRYSTVRQDLEKIKEISGSAGTEEELSRVLPESIADPKELVASDIEALEAVLKPREIEEVNELLIWTVAGYDWFSLESLTAALFLRFNTVPLQPLIQKVTGRYSKLFTLNSYQALTLREFVEGHIITEEYRPRDSPDDPTITATITISNASIKAVQRFFWDLNHHSFTEGFTFKHGSDGNDSFHGKIQLNMIDANYQILKQAFEFFRKPSVDRRAKAIGWYLMGYIPDHLRALYDDPGFNNLEERDKNLIWSYINEMFSVGNWIEKNWEYQEWVSWYCRSEEIATFWKWLDDPVAASHLKPLEKKWLADLKAEEDPNKALLTPVMTTIARHWLQNDDWDVLEAYRWIEGFLVLVRLSIKYVCVLLIYYCRVQRNQPPSLRTNLRTNLRLNLRLNLRMGPRTNPRPSRGRRSLGAKQRTNLRLSLRPNLTTSLEKSLETRPN
jgi:DNA replication protein DnaC